MSKREHADLIDRFAAHVAPAVEPQAVTERALDVLLCLSGGHSAALFVSAGQGLSRLMSRGRPQSFDLLAAEAWERHHATLCHGDPYVPEMVLGEGAAVVPILIGGHLRGVICVGAPDLAADDSPALRRLRRGVPALGRMLFGRGTAPVLVDERA